MRSSVPRLIAGQLLFLGKAGNRELSTLVRQQHYIRDIPGGRVDRYDEIYEKRSAAWRTTETRLLDVRFARVEENNRCEITGKSVNWYRCTAMPTDLYRDAIWAENGNLNV